MSLKEYSREELEVRSMLELANEYLLEEQEAKEFNMLFDKIADLKGFSEERKQEYIAQFYTDLTIDGRFLTINTGVWGLKRWYPVEQMDEIVAPAPKKKKKKAKKKTKEKAEIPHEASEEENAYSDDDVEILTGTFDDEILDEPEELGGSDGFDDEMDEADDDFDEEEEHDESDDEENK